MADAHADMAADPRFAIETVMVDGAAVRHWVTGPKTIDDVVALHRSHGEREFLVYEDDRCTYGGAVRAADVVANALLSAGLQPGDRVALLMRNRTEWPVCFVAAMRAGGIVVPINGWALPTQIADTLVDCGARFLFCDRADVPVPGTIELVLSVNDAGGGSLRDLIGAPSTWSGLPDRAPSGPAASADAIAAIFYTSGTTSRPKGATITHRALTATIKNSEFNAERIRIRFGASPMASAAPPVALFPIPLFHVTGAIPGLIATSAVGATLVLMRKWDVGDALRLIERERVTILGGVPTMPLQIIADPRHVDHDLSSLASVIYGGAPPPTGLPEAIGRSLAAEASTGWGMTETASTLLNNGGPQYRLRPESCGVANLVNDVRIADADADDAVLAIGATGELQVRGLNVTRGYGARPEETDRAFTADGWFRTGDVARMDAEGFVTIVDRQKDMIIRGGENIACIEIEDALCTHPAVVEAAVVALPHPMLGEEPVAFVALAAGHAASERELRDHVAARLPRFKVPVSLITTTDALPRNAAGKILKQELRMRLVTSVMEDTTNG
jgi:long-chain acyl-CoA synthetase